MAVSTPIDSAGAALHVRGREGFEGGSPYGPLNVIRHRREDSNGSEMTAVPAQNGGMEPGGLVAANCAAPGDCAQPAVTGTISADDIMATRMGLNMTMAATMAAAAAAAAAGVTNNGSTTPHDTMDLDFEMDVDWTGMLDIPNEVSRAAVPTFHEAAAATTTTTTTTTTITSNDPVVPHDRLFAEDEMVQASSIFVGGFVPMANPQQQQQQAPVDPAPDAWSAFEPLGGNTPKPNPPTNATQVIAQAQSSLNLNDPTTLQLYDQVLLWYFNALAQGELIFDGCDPSKEAVLHRLAMRFQLSYSFDAVFRRASIRRVNGLAAPPAVPSAVRPPPHVPHAGTSGQPTGQIATAPSNALGISPLGSQAEVNCPPSAVAGPLSPPPLPPPQVSTHMVPTSQPAASSSTRAPSTNQLHRLSLPASPYPSSPYPTSPFVSSPFSSPDLSFYPRQPGLESAAPSFGLVEPDWSSRSSLALSRTSTSSGLSSFSSRTGSLSPATIAPATFSSVRDEFISVATGASGSGVAARPRDRSSKIGDSISQRVSTWKIFSGTGKSLGIHRGRKGPLNAYSRDKMRVLEQVGGACWRCKVIKRKCDAGNPCKSCPAPHLGEDAPLWPVIGCRRGSLCDAMPRQSLCPKSRRPGSRSTMFNSSGFGASDRNWPEIAAKHLRRAEEQRMLDADQVSAHVATPLLAQRGNPEAAGVFASIIAGELFSSSVSLNRPCRIRDKSLTCADLITSIAWELADNRDLASLLEIDSAERFITLLQTACTYEAEVAKSSTSLVIFSVICLRYSLDTLRLYNANLIGPEAHSTCTTDQCSITSIRVLCSYLAAYVDELSLVMFKKENLRDRRWWLSTFYSLCIQSHVRHVLLQIEKELIFPGYDDPPAESLYSTQYLHLAAILFTAASAQYDPLIGGRLQYALTDDSVVPETSVPELHHLSARNVFEVEKWAENGIKTSYSYLRHLLQIGSLDFETDGTDTRMIDIQCPDGNRPDFSAVATPVSSLGFDGDSQTCPSRTLSMYSNSSISDASLNSFWTQCTESTNNTHLTLPPTDSFATDRRRSKASLYSVTSPSPLSTATTPGPEQDGASCISLEPDSQLPRSIPDPLLVCKCCPKKPQQFQTAEQLTAHENEKPYPCTTCHSRFKTAAEAERHINAVHRRPDSWCCARLGGPREAFHSLRAEADGTMYDICGYCGRGFERVGATAEEMFQNLENHVKTDHVFGACNRDKKFYRADHFRQHLKVFHAAVPGRWNKFLERACKARELGDDQMMG